MHALSQVPSGGGYVKGVGGHPPPSRGTWWGWVCQGDGYSSPDMGPGGASTHALEIGPRMLPQEGTPLVLTSSGGY